MRKPKKLFSNKLKKLAEERQAKIESLTQLVEGKVKEVQEKNDQLQKDLAASKQSFDTLTQEKIKVDQAWVSLNDALKLGLPKPVSSFLMSQDLVRDDA